MRANGGGNKRFIEGLPWKDFYFSFAQSCLENTDSPYILDFTSLTLDGRMLAAHFGFIASDRLYYFTPTYDIEFAKYSPGKVLLNWLIERAFEKKIIFDFQNDMEPYKLQYANGVASRYVLSIYL